MDSFESIKKRTQTHLNDLEEKKKKQVKSDEGQDIDALFAQMRQIQEEDEERRRNYACKSEKRFLRLALVNKKAKYFDEDAARIYYEEYKESAKRDYFTAYDDHICDERSECSKKSLDKGTKFLDPTDEKTVLVASGEVYVCEISGRSHRCQHGSICRYTKEIYSTPGTYVCSFTGLYKGAVMRALLHTEDGTSYVPDGEYDRDDFEGCEFDNDEEFEERVRSSGVSSSSSSSSFYRGRRGNRGKAAAQAPKVPVRDVIVSTPDCQKLLMRLAKDMDEGTRSLMAEAKQEIQTLLNIQTILPSVQKDMQKVQERISQAMRVMPEHRKDGLDFMHVMMYHLVQASMPTVQASMPIFQAAHHQDTLREGRVAYYSAIVARFWKLIKLTPAGSEMKSFSLKRVAVSLMFMLKDGIMMRFFYNKETRRIIVDNEDALELDKPKGPTGRYRLKKNVREKCIPFVPRHPYLNRLPNESELVHRNQHEKMMKNKGNIFGAFESLKDEEFTIDQVDCYRLINFVTFRNEYM